MKKYIFGLISAICLVGAGCTEFEDFKPTDMGEGPEVVATLTKEDMDAFTMIVEPAAEAVYYSYILTTDSLTDLDPMKLLQAKYDGAELVSVTEYASIKRTFTSQAMATTYYLYAVASNEDGLCGDIAVASLLLPDEEKPYVIAPTAWQYKATNKGRSVTIEFNEPVVRGAGAITYKITSDDGMTETDNGTIETIAVNSNEVTITLPEAAKLPEAEGAVAYVFLDFAAGAFVDDSGNLSDAMKGGLDENYNAAAPWWEYTAGSADGPALEVDEEGVGGYTFAYTSAADGEDYGEAVSVYTNAAVGNPEFPNDYAIVGLASYAYVEGADIYILPADIEGENLNWTNGAVVGYCDWTDGNQYGIAVISMELGADGSITPLFEEAVIPFYVYDQEPRALVSDVVIGYFLVDLASSSLVAAIEGATNSIFAPSDLFSQQAAVAKTMVPELNKKLQIAAFRNYVETEMGLSFVNVRK